MRLPFVLIVVLAGCMPAEPDFRDVQDGGWDQNLPDSGSPDCPSHTVFIVGGDFALGEADESRVGDINPEMIIRRSDFTVADVCVGLYPFPGVRGAAWPSDGLNLDGAEALNDHLADFGRRLCTVPELLLAAAGPENERYPYGPEHRVDVCDPSGDSPSLLGTWVNCVSPTGVRDFGVRSTWGAVTDDLVAALEPHGLPWGAGERSLVAYGGTSRQNTFYAPTNFGVHAHSLGEEAYGDDGARVCRDPRPIDAAEEERWAVFVDDFGSSGFSGLLGR
jgi:hypothetical protein